VTEQDLLNIIIRIVVEDTQTREKYLLDTEFHSRVYLLASLIARRLHPLLTTHPAAPQPRSKARRAPKRPGSTTKRSATVKARKRPYKPRGSAPPPPYNMSKLRTVFAEEAHGR
jgi:hypothetical protein